MFERRDTEETERRVQEIIERRIRPLELAVEHLERELRKLRFRFERERPVHEPVRVSGTQVVLQS